MWILMCKLSTACFYFFKQKTAYEMRMSDGSSDVCSSDLPCSGGSACMVSARSVRERSRTKPNHDDRIPPARSDRDRRGREVLKSVRTASFQIDPGDLKPGRPAPCI